MPAGNEHLGEHADGGADRAEAGLATMDGGGAEEDPADYDAKEYKLAVEPSPGGGDVGDDPAARLEGVEGDEHRAVPGAPDDEEPRRAVPEAAEEHGDHEV